MYKYILGVLAMSLSLNLSTASAAPTIQSLPAPQTTGGKPLMEVLQLRRTDREFATKPIDDQTLSEILWTAWGISHDGKRTIPTSMNKQNLNVYVVREDGAWFYNAEKNQLEQVSNKDLRPLLATQDYVSDIPLHLIYTGSDKTNTPLHAGSSYQNVGLYAASKGLHNVVRAWFDKEKFAQALNLPKNEEVFVSQAIGWPN